MSYSQMAVIAFVFALSTGLNREVRADVVATVNGKPITTEDAQLQFFLKQLPDAKQPSQTETMINNLIDRQLIEQFLLKKNIKADKFKIEHQMTLIRKLIEKKEEKLEEVFKRMNLTEESLQHVLELNLAWETYVEQVVAEKDIAYYFQEHRNQVDGTRVEAAQIVIVLNSESAPQAWIEAETKLSKVREEIESGKLTFSHAAMQYSGSPSGNNGGDLGKFEYTGRLPQAITKVAFSLKPNEVSHPFRSPFGVHIVKIKQIIPGQLSLEDVRPEILNIKSQQLWIQQVAEERIHSTIELAQPTK